MQPSGRTFGLADGARTKVRIEPELKFGLSPN
jgi:hypothetical protein